ncbi:unnamed protein product [Phyllotreta striolata]|uniref:Uncharacterized protein n=1 Tax=Phyllotreta striolata TaxID=444603 RepID=A0A9N9TIL3_PHYSR|nr:unnamed protein product [Phyllotreta striolata]
MFNNSRPKMTPLYVVLFVCFAGAIARPSNTDEGKSVNLLPTGRIQLRDMLTPIEDLRRRVDGNVRMKRLPVVPYLPTARLSLNPSRNNLDVADETHQNPVRVEYRRK